MSHTDHQSNDHLYHRPSKETAKNDKDVNHETDRSRADPHHHLFHPDQWRGLRRQTPTEGAHKAGNNTQDNDREVMKGDLVIIGTGADRTGITAGIDREIGEDNKETILQVGGLRLEDTRQNAERQPSPGATDLDQLHEPDRNTKRNPTGPTPQTHPFTNQSC